MSSPQREVCALEPAPDSNVEGRANVDADDVDTAHGLKESDVLELFSDDPHPRLVRQVNALSLAASNVDSIAELAVSARAFQWTASFMKGDADCAA